MGTNGRERGDSRFGCGSGQTDGLTMTLACTLKIASTLKSARRRIPGIGLSACVLAGLIGVVEGATPAQAAPRPGVEDLQVPSAAMGRNVLVRFQPGGS